MAYVSSHTARKFNLADIVAQAIAVVRDSLRRRAVYARTLAELEALSDRDLADMNLHRANIVEVARGAAYGN